MPPNDTGSPSGMPSAMFAGSASAVADEAILTVVPSSSRAFTATIGVCGARSRMGDQRALVSCNR